MLRFLNLGRSLLRSKLRILRFLILEGSLLRLRLRNLGFKVRIAELLMRQNNTDRIKELEKNKADSSTNNVRCDAENAELKAKVTKLEQDSKQSQEDQEPAHIPDSIIAQLEHCKPEYETC